MRDVFTMGARPIASMNALSASANPRTPKRAQLVHGVVEGIGGYGNCLSVCPARVAKSALTPPITATASSTPSPQASPTRTRSSTPPPLAWACPSSTSAPRPGRDGVGGATMASAEFDDTIEEKRPTVQVGDPFTEKRLMEATLELMQTGAVISIQDMGAAGLTCSAVEMGDKGGLGRQARTFNDVPVREENMTAYEMMLSGKPGTYAHGPQSGARSRSQAPSLTNGTSTSPSWVKPSPEDRFLILNTTARSKPTCPCRNWPPKPPNTIAHGSLRPPPVPLADIPQH